MKIFTKLFCIALLSTITVGGMSQNNNKITPRDVLAKCHIAGSNFDYNTIKECVSERYAVYVDELKRKIESPDMKFQKGLIAAAIQTAQYEVVDENISANGKSATLKTKVSVTAQTFTADIVFVKENNCWKIDNVPNAKDIPEQVPILKQFIK